MDYLAEMIEFAKARRPHLHLQVADMRTLRLGRTFDAIMCMGSAFMYALTNADVSRVLNTFVAHSHPGTLLILDINNAASYLGGDQFKQTSELRVSSASFSAVAHATYRFDRRRLDAMLAFLADLRKASVMADTWTPNSPRCLLPMLRSIWPCVRTFCSCTPTT